MYTIIYQITAVLGGGWGGRPLIKSCEISIRYTPFKIAHECANKKYRLYGGNRRYVES